MNIIESDIGSNQVCQPLLNIWILFKIVAEQKQIHSFASKCVICNRDALPIVVVAHVSSTFELRVELRELLMHRQFLLDQLVSDSVNILAILSQLVHLVERVDHSLHWETEGICVEIEHLVHPCLGKRIIRVKPVQLGANSTQHSKDRVRLVESLIVDYEEWDLTRRIELE